MSYYPSYCETSGAAFNAVLDVSFSEEENVPFITREEAKTWLRIDSVQDNVIVDTLIRAAIGICEKYLNISIVNRTVTATINNRCGNIYLPYGPVKEITSITNVNGTVLDFEAQQFTISGQKFKRLTWPLEDNITMVYTAGYGETECVPAEIKMGVLCQVAYMYENRGDETGLKSQLSPMAKGHLKSMRMI